MTAHDILAKIEARLGFVPPFFGAAAEHPQVLANLWQQTESGYLDNELPALFKEKLAALLGRYCEIPYCLVCHTCTLRPLGMSGTAVVDLLTQKHPSSAEITDALRRLGGSRDPLVIDSLGAEQERDICCLCSAVYFGGPLAASARTRLRERVSPADYRSIVVFVSYNRMCHEWVAAHPEISFELDQRYLQNYGQLVAEAPQLGLLLESSDAKHDRDPDAHREAVASQRAAEAPAIAAMAERRVHDVLDNLRGRVAAATAAASEKGQLAEELRRAADFAQELLAIVSHDLRNPLGNVLAGATLVLQLEPDNARIARPLGRMISSARRAERLIYDLLDFSLARAGGGIPIAARACDLHALVRSAVDDLAVTHPGRPVTLQLDGDGLGDWDADRIEQVLSNLLANAVSHGRLDSPIEVGVRGAPDGVAITIRNANRNGPIPDELLPVLFDPFERGVARAVSATRSIGLGLYIVDAVVRGHRGRIEVSSNADTTAFTVHLPRTSQSPAP